MPVSPIPGRTNWRHWAAICCGLMMVTLVGVGPAQAAQERSPLGQVQRLLPATTVALVVVPVHDEIRAGLAQVLNPEQKTEALLARLSSISVDRTGSDLWSTKTVVGFLCESGEQGVLLLGPFGDGGLKNTDRRIGGLPVISAGDGYYLARLGSTLALAPRETLELLSRVYRAKSHRLLGTKRLVAFRSIRDQLSGDGLTVYLEGSWLMEKVRSKDKPEPSSELAVVAGSYRGGHATFHATGSKKALSDLRVVVEEAVNVLKLQHEMLSEIDDSSDGFGERMSRVLIMETIEGLLKSIVIEPSPARLIVRLSLPLGLNTATMSLWAAMVSGSGAHSFEALKPLWTR